MELRHDQVTVAGASIHTVTAGPPGAPGLLLLHGWPESWATWRELIPLAAPGYRRARHRRHGDLRLPAAVPRPGPRGDHGCPAARRRALHAVPDLPERLVAGREAGYFGYFYDLLSAVPGVPAEAVRREQAGAYATPGALTAGFGWYRAFNGDVQDNQDSASGPRTVTPLLYLRGGAERGGPVDAFADGLRRAGVADVRPAVIDGAGHYPHEEDPAATWRAISGFISSTAASAPSEKGASS
jgi:pimeloyl-ACP methyl ester carboxylesterase